jgi:hypothetical protein
VVARLGGQRADQCVGGVHAGLEQAVGEQLVVQLAALGGPELGGRQDRGADGVHDDAADREPDRLQLGHAVDRLLHGHLLEQRAQVHRGLRRAQDGHHAVGLGLERSDLGQAAHLAADVQEARDPAGRRPVEHHGVVDRPAL